MTDVADDLIGVTIGGCRILEAIGQGGMARVYHAVQRHLERDVALKVLPPSYVADPTFISRFQIEARAMARLRHPNIVTIFDAGEERNLLYIVMEYIAGGTLRARMQQAMPIVEAADIIRDLAEALTYAHEQGIIHRDVKPVNVLIDTSLLPRGRLRAVLTDFGIAKLLEGAPHLTRTGAGVGTPEYMSPEQCRGQPVDARADIYALGIVLYELMCGRPPFASEDYTAIAHSQCYEPPPPPSLYHPNLSPAIQAVIYKALEKRPEQRYQTARELAAALDAAIGLGAALHPTPPPRGQGLCPKCGTANAPAMNFCARCGANLRGSPPSQGASVPARSVASVANVACPACGASNAGTHRFCTRCGVRLPTISCGACGRASPPDQRACVHCGQPLTR